jgi:hypothetical protein
MYADSKRRIEAIKVLILKFQDCECVVCHTDFNKCGHYYTLAEAYLEKIEEKINEKEGKK